MTRTIEGVRYQAKARKSTHNQNVCFYPLIEFTCKVMNESYYLNTPHPTRSKALTFAKNYIKNL